MGPVAAARLGTAHQWSVDLQPLLTGTAGAAAPSQPFTPFPNFADLLVPEAEVERILEAVEGTGATLRSTLTDIFSEASGFLIGAAGRFRNQASREAAFSNARINRQLGVLSNRADDLTSAIVATRRVAAERPDTGFEVIAQAYEQWLQSDGMSTLLEHLGNHFEQVQPGTPDAERTSRLLRGEIDRPRARVEIENVEVIVSPPPDAEEATGADEGATSNFTFEDDERIYMAVLRHMREREERGDLVGAGAAFEPVPV
jgi:hypothetical protein